MRPVQKGSGSNRGSELDCGSTRSHDLRLSENSKVKFEAKVKVMCMILDDIVIHTIFELIYIVL
jgi:hypothetical protein